jgi:hypothetical protein
MMYEAKQVPIRIVAQVSEDFGKNWRGTRCIRAVGPQLAEALFDAGRRRCLEANVLLIESLGGGWNISDLASVIKNSYFDRPRWFPNDDGA